VKINTPKSSKVAQPEKEREKIAAKPTHTQEKSSRKPYVQSATKQKARKQNSFRGKNQDQCEIAPKKFIHLFVGKVKLDCKDEEVRESIKEFLNIEEFKRIESKSSRYKCFYLKVPFIMKEEAYNPMNWPNNVHVARYYFPRKESVEKRNGNSQLNPSKDPSKDPSSESTAMDADDANDNEDCNITVVPVNA